MPIPIFSTNHSIGKSILTIELDKDKDKKFIIKPNSPVSIISISQIYEMNPIVVVETDISGYWKLYKNTKDINLQFIFGIKLSVCANLDDKSEDAWKSESDVIIFLKNEKAYYDMVKLYSFASLNGSHQHRKIDWQRLQEMWTENFELCIPFYSSFIARNLMEYGHCSLPSFGNISPTFIIENHGLPFDKMIADNITNYCSSNNSEIINGHSVLYYKNEDAMKLLTIKCMRNRRGQMVTNWEKPNLEHFGSDKFSFESYLNLEGKKLK